MKVLVIGGTGYIGVNLVRRLRAAGHTPVTLARRAGSGSPEVETRLGDLAAPDTLRAAVTSDIDGVVHAAAPTGDWDADRIALRAIVDSLAGSEVRRPLVYLSGAWVLGARAEAADETAVPRPIELVAGRERLEEDVLAAVDVRGVVIRPGVVHGHGGGIPRMLVDWARAAGAGRFVGDPTVRWPMVHVDDLADLGVLALGSAAAGSVLHAVAEAAVPVKELAVAADLAAGGLGRCEPWAEGEAATELGAAFAAALALDQEVLAPAARRLGWSPAGPDAVSDLQGAAYRL